MDTDIAVAPVSRSARCAGRVLSGIVVALPLVDGGNRLVPIAPVTQTLDRLGYGASPDPARGLGVLTPACTALHAVPRTAALGAVLLTGLLSGAMASQLRVGNPVFSHLLFGAYLGLMAWGGLLLRGVLPLRRARHVA